MGCQITKEDLSNLNLNYKYKNICEDMINLKEFIKLRDTHPAFDGLRGKGMLGIPAVRVGDNVMIGLNEEKLKEWLEE